MFAIAAQSDSDWWLDAFISLRGLRHSMVTPGAEWMVPYSRAITNWAGEYPCYCLTKRSSVSVYVLLFASKVTE